MANKTSMKLVLQVEEGKNRSKTISNINPAATNETLSAAAAKLTSVQKKNLVGVQRLDTTDITL